MSESEQVNAEMYQHSLPPNISTIVAEAIVKWLHDNARICAHGCIHITCGDCSPLRLTR